MPLRRAARCLRAQHGAAPTLCALALWLAAQAQPLSADVGLWFVRSPEPLVAPPGDEVVFECSLNVPADHVRWRHASAFLPHPAAHAASADAASAGNHSVARAGNHLVVKVLDHAQTGDYQCVAWYGASALASVPARLSLAELKPFAPARPASAFDAFEGNTVALRLDAPESNPPAILQCHKDGHKLNTTVSANGVLLLANVSRRDAGRYVCSAYNYITGQTLHNAHELTLAVKPATVNAAPSFPQPMQDSYVVQAGWNVTLVCAGGGSPPPRVTWSRYGGDLPRDRAVVVDDGLALRHVARGDEGTYICHLGNGVGQPLTHVIALHLHEAPVVLKEPANVIGEEGGDVTLECSFRGTPNPQVSWLLNGESLEHDSHVKTHGARLQITSAAKRHAGIFQCFGTNALGAAYGSALLQVSPRQVTANPAADATSDDARGGQHDGSSERDEGGPTAVLPTSGVRGKSGHNPGPGGRRKDKHKHKGNTVMVPPTRPNITRLTDGSVMVRWSVPPNAGLPIQFFKVQHREMATGGGGGTRRRGGGKGSRWMTNNDDIPPHVRSYEVDGLDTDHTYRFRIAAVYSNNDNKLGPNSGRFHLHRGPTNSKHPLSPPLLTHTEAVSATAIQIHWEHQAQPSAPIEGFYVYYRATSSAGDYVKATVEGEATRAFNITHLQHETAYDIKLQSFTVGGASDFSAILTHKTLSAPTEQPPPAPPEVVSASTGPPGVLPVAGAVVGGLAVLAGIALAVVVCRRRRNASRQRQASTERDGKTNGEAPTLSLEPAVFGKTHANGFLHATSRVNITTNPLAESPPPDKNQIVMEMSFLSSQNNNCSAGSSAGTSAGSSGSGDEGDPPPPPTPPRPHVSVRATAPCRAPPPKPAPPPPEPWRGNAAAHSANQLVENYV